MKIFLLLVIIAFGFQNLVGQNVKYERNKAELKDLGLTFFDSDSHIKFVRIWFNEYQVLELSQTSYKYSGQLVNYVTKSRKKKRKGKIISQNITLNEDIANRIINEIWKEQIKDLPEYKDLSCNVLFIDIPHAVFEFCSKEKSRSFAYPCTINISDKCSCPELKKVANLLHYINTNLNLWEKFSNYLESLPKGSYNYGCLGMEKLK